jgi:hypothetical protein
MNGMHSVFIFRRNIWLMQIPPNVVVNADGWCVRPAAILSRCYSDGWRAFVCPTSLAVMSRHISRCDVTFSRLYTPCYSETKDVITSKSRWVLWAGASYKPGNTVTYILTKTDSKHGRYHISYNITPQFLSQSPENWRSALQSHMKFNMFSR